jgi:SRSO17 transposase
MPARIETTPKMDWAIPDMAHVVEELGASHALYSPLLQRREQREAAPPALQGVLAPLPRQSIEPLVLAVAGVAPKAGRARQALSSAGPWNDERRVPQHWKAVATAWGTDEGGLMVDGSDVPQHGSPWVGGKRQDWGELGQRANCQAGVFVGEVSPPGSPVRERRGSVPVEWLTDDAYAERRRPGGIPSARLFKTQPAVAQEMLAAVVKSQALRWRWVGAAEAFGDHPGFLEGGAGRGRGDFAAVPPSPRVWEERPAPHIPPWRGRGRRPQRERLRAGAPAARTGLAMAAALPAEAWTRQPIKDGRQGPLGAAFATLRGGAVRDALPGPALWVGLRRHREPGELKTSLGHAPGATPLATRGRMSGRRWPLETCFEDRKPLLGRGDYEGRSGTGWPPHMTLVIRAHFFVVRLGLR